MPTTRALTPSIAALASALALAAAPPDADACGGFFRTRSTKTVTLPSLQVEQVLLLHDPASEQEHFVREIVFSDAKEPFGFVVPTPSQPRVAKVEKSPFQALSDRFPPEPPEGVAGFGFGGGFGRLGGGSGASRTVTVISEEKVGSFTAFVLSATDAGALKKWLDDNQLATTSESEAWLAHYVERGFFFVAFRYEPRENPAAHSKSETVDISFTTPLPYYPYLEPAHAPDPSRPYRVLAVWLISPSRSVPVAAFTDGGATLWKRPWREARKHPTTSPADVAKAIGPELAALLPQAVVQPDEADSPRAEKRLVVQTFEDQKSSRKGFGDVVLVPESPAPASAARSSHLDKLMLALDPLLPPSP